MRAAKIAEKVSQFGGARVAAIVVSRKNIIIGKGYNHSKSNPFAAKYGKNPSAIFFHAETHAIYKSLKNDPDSLNGSTIYICRLKKDKPMGKTKWGMAKPCSGCMQAISEFGIKRIVYSMNGDYEYNVLHRDDF